MPTTKLLDDFPTHPQKKSSESKAGSKSPIPKKIIKIMFATQQITSKLDKENSAKLDIRLRKEITDLESVKKIADLLESDNDIPVPNPDDQENSPEPETE